MTILDLNLGEECVIIDAGKSELNLEGFGFISGAKIKLLKKEVEGVIVVVFNNKFYITNSVALKIKVQKSGVK